MTDTVRVFMAFLPSEATKSEWQDLQLKIAQQSEDVWRWTRAEQLHMTLFFWGYMASEALPALTQIVQTAKLPSDHVMPLRQIEGFPSAHKARVLALSGPPTQALEQFYQQLSLSLAAHGFLEDQKPLRPHVTLGRRRKPGPSAPFPLSTALELNHLALIQSILGPQGPEYILLAERNQ